MPGVGGYIYIQVDGIFYFLIIFKLSLLMNIGVILFIIII